MANDIHSKVQRVGFLKQSDTSNQWSAPNTASSNYQTVLGVPTSVTPTPATRVQEPDFTSSQGTMPEQGRIFIDKYTEFPSIKYSAYANATELPHYLAAAFQYGTQGITPDFLKRFYPANDPDLDFSNNEGFLFTIAQRNYDSGSVGDGRLLTNALLREFTLKHSGIGTGLDRHIMLDLDWVGKDMSVDQHLTGTWLAQPTIAATDTFAWGYLTLVIGSNTFTVCYRNFEMKITNTIEVPCKTEIGVASNYRLAKQSLMFTIDIPYTSATYKTYSSFKDGDLCTLSWAKGESNTGLALNFQKCYLTENPYVYDGDYVALRLSLMVTRPTNGFGVDGTGLYDVVTVLDSVDWGY